MDQSQQWSIESAEPGSRGYCDCSLRWRSVLPDLPFLASALFGTREAKIAGDTLRLERTERAGKLECTQIFSCNARKSFGKKWAPTASDRLESQKAAIGEEFPAGLRRNGRIRGTSRGPEWLRPPGSRLESWPHDAAVRGVGASYSPPR